MHRLLVAALAALMLLVPLAAARADDAPPEQAVLMQLFGTGPLTPDMFAPSFLAQASMDQILDVFTHTRAAVGAPMSVEKAGKSYIVHTAGFAIPVDIGLDTTGKVASLTLHTPVPNIVSTSDVLTALGGLQGSVSWLVTKDGSVVYSHQPDQPLAVSSGFKLGVLAALGDEITAGHFGWDKVVKLDPGEVSLTPGTLGELPPGSPITVHTLAAFMASESDNTATDALIDLLGRDKVAARLGTEFVLKTTEFYKLKADPALGVRFAAATAADKAKMVDDLAKTPLPDPANVGGALDQGVEWYLSSTKLCDLIGTVAGMDVFTINKGVARPDQWDKIAFKSGSEVGVASLTTALVDKSGAKYCVTVTENDTKPLDEGRVTTLYGGLIASLAAN